MITYGFSEKSMAPMRYFPLSFPESREKTDEKRLRGFDRIAVFDIR